MALRERVRMGTHAWTPPSSTSTEADDRDRVIAHAIDVMLTSLDTDPDLAGVGQGWRPPMPVTFAIPTTVNGA